MIGLRAKQSSLYHVKSLATETITPQTSSLLMSPGDVKCRVACQACAFSVGQQFNSSLTDP